MQCVETERKEIEDSLEEAIFVNNSLEEKVEHYSQYENKFQEQTKKFEALTRSNCILKREFESIKDLYREQKDLYAKVEKERKM